MTVSVYAGSASWSKAIVGVLNTNELSTSVTVIKVSEPDGSLMTLRKPSSAIV